MSFTLHFVGLVAMTAFVAGFFWTAGCWLFNWLVRPRQRA